MTLEESNTTPARQTRKRAPKRQFPIEHAKKAHARKEQMETIRKIVEACGGSLHGAADRLDTSPSVISFWLRGAAQPKAAAVEKIERLARELRIDLPKNLQPVRGCDVKGCIRKPTSAVSRLCATHRRRLRMFGSPTASLPKKPPLHASRDEDILFAVEVDGRSFADVAREYGLTRERVRQIAERLRGAPLEAN